MICHREENISAIEIERAILPHPGVRNCAVIGVASATGEDDIKAVVQLHEGHTVTPVELVEFCAERIAYFKVPRYVEFTAELPVSVTKGDVERHELHEKGAGDREAAGHTLRRHR